jgi:site-specific recombinase XerD
MEGSQQRVLYTPEILQDFREHLQREKLSPKSVGFYSKDVKSFLSFLNSREIALNEVDEQNITDYFASSEMAYGSAWRALSSIRKLAKFMRGMHTEGPDFDSGAIYENIKRLPKHRVSKIDENAFSKLIDSIRDREPSILQGYLKKRDITTALILHYGKFGLDRTVKLNADEFRTFPDARTFTISVDLSGFKDYCFEVPKKYGEILNYLEARNAFQRKKGTNNPALLLNHFGERLTQRSIRRKLEVYGERAGLEDVTPISLGRRINSIDEL